MAKKDNIIFTVLHIIAWLIFVGLCIEAGGLIVNFFFNIYKPEFVPRLYQKLDLSEMYNSSRLVFYGMYGFILAVALLKVYLFYIVIILLMKMDLATPFNRFVSDSIMKISYCTFSIGILSYIARGTAKNMQHHGFVTEPLSQFWEDSSAFILMAAVIYIIAVIFKKGVEIQTENDLTV